MKTQYLKLFLLPGFGALVGGSMWLGAYMAVHTDDGIGYDGPAGGIMLLSVFAGWLICTLFALTMMKGKFKVDPASALIVVILSGAIFGYIVSFLIGTYARDHLS